MNDKINWIQKARFMGFLSCMYKHLWFPNQYQYKENFVKFVAERY